MSQSNEPAFVDERQAKSIIRQYKDKDFSYCDAVSFVLMERGREVDHRFR